MHRPRRLRTSDAMRRLARETALSPDNLMYPVFVCTGKNIKEEISSMPGVFRYSLDRFSEELEEIRQAGIRSILIFGLPESKDEHATAAWDEKGPVQQAIRMTKETYPQIVVSTDICVCSYTTHGHCGIIENNYVHNDKSLEVLVKMALSHARAGADIVAPSAMMDLQVAAIRQALDAEKFYETAIMAYAAKYYSACYGPFREAADSAPQFGNRATYQMDTANAREALKEIILDVEEGADIIMVKPAIFYLDIVYQAYQNVRLPIAAYNVSGEYSMIKAAAEKGWIDGEKVMLEMLLSIKRAGASLIITYFAKEAAQLLQKNEY